MGQFYTLINIDKKKKLCLGIISGIFGAATSKYLCHPDKQHSWAGDRLILFGDHVDDSPAGIEDEPRYEDMFAMFTHYSDGEEADYCPPNPNECYYDETSVLRNICTREYVRADLFPDRSSHPGFSDLITTKILWRGLSRESLNPLVLRGPWAGGRFDIVHVNIVQDDLAWKDVTEIEFFDYYKWLFKDDFWALDPDCTCRLCHKYRNEHEGFYKNINKLNEPHQPNRVHEIVVERTNPASRDAIHASYPSVARLSAIETLPTELHEEILGYLSIGDWATYTAASKRLSFQATRRLYTSVTLESADQTKTLLEAISRRPELTSYIKKLRVVTLAHWESLQVAHEILKQLPALESLNFARCWLSYGNLPSWEYPFTLQTLTWGFKKDSAFVQFCRSQPAARILVQEPVIGGLYF